MRKFWLIILGLIATTSAWGQLGYTPSPIVLYDSSGNPFPTGSGTPLSYTPPAITCYTIVSGSVVPCVFTGGGGGAPTGPAGGDLGGTYPNPSVVALNGTNLAALGTGFLFNATGTGIPSSIGSTGTGNVVLSTSPTLVTPALGTPSALVLTNAIGLPNASVIGLGTAATVNTGTSGATIPLLNGVNTWASAQTFSATLVGSVAIESGAFASAASTNNVTYQGGQDAGSSSTLGSATLRGANNTSTGNAGNATLQAGRNTNATPGVQGWATVIESFVTASALATTFNVVSGTATADQVAATGLGVVTGVVGIAQTVGGTNTQVNVASYGKTTVRFDGTPVIGDTACAPPPSTGTAGLAHDNSTTACTTSSLIGVVTGQVSGSGSGATATVLLKLN